MAATASLEVATGSPQVPWHGFKPGLWQKEVNVLNREMLLDAKSPFELPVWVRFVLVPGLTDAGAVRGRVRDLPCRGARGPLTPQPSAAAHRCRARHRAGGRPR